MQDRNVGFPHDRHRQNHCRKVQGQSDCCNRALPHWSIQTAVYSNCQGHFWPLDGEEEQCDRSAIAPQLETRDG